MHYFTTFLVTSKLEILRRYKREKYARLMGVNNMENVHEKYSLEVCRPEFRYFYEQKKQQKKT